MVTIFRLHHLTHVSDHYFYRLKKKTHRKSVRCTHSEFKPPVQNTHLRFCYALLTERRI